MHPNVFLKTFWRLDVRPQIFVAMSFDDKYKQRYEQIFVPAISAITVNGVPLTPYRVDLSKTGDAILTDIMDGIAHSHMVLADVSTVGKDSVTGFHYRNGNVMYEVGIALACRQPQEVLLVRDDEDKFLFDVSTVPHLKLNFGDIASARAMLHEKLKDRLRARSFFDDARVQMAIDGLSIQEVQLLGQVSPGQVWGFEKSNLVTISAVPRLLDKQLIRVVGRFEEGHPAYVFTTLGEVVFNLVKSRLRTFKKDPPPQPDPKEGVEPT